MERKVRFNQSIQSVYLSMWRLTNLQLVTRLFSLSTDQTKGVFGLPLRVSLKYASVAISMAGEDGNQYVWGYIPVVVAKVGLYLKENGE